jgi:hypothetical protein
MPLQAKRFGSAVLCGKSTSTHPAPFLHPMLCSPLPRLIMVATRGVMEILGLDPYQSQTQYLGHFDRDSINRKCSGNLFPPYFLFISTLFPLLALADGLAEIMRKYVSASEAYKLKGDNICDDGYESIENLPRQACTGCFCRGKENSDYQRSCHIFALLESSFIACDQWTDRGDSCSASYFNWTQEADLAEFPA